MLTLCLLVHTIIALKLPCSVADKAFRSKPRKISNQIVRMSSTKKPLLLPSDRIIIALDFSSLKDAEPLIRQLKDRVGLFKVGLTMMLSEGIKNIVAKIKDITGKDQNIFADLKFSEAIDIPWQMGGVSSLFCDSKGLAFVTTHIESKKSLKEFVDKFKNGTKVLGLTILTSKSESEIEQSRGVDILNAVATLSNTAKEAGCHGVVCSGQEAKVIRKLLGPDLIIVTPGIRPSWSKIKGDDQKRIVTPQEAILNGADYIVVGRPIYMDKDPVGAAMKISDEIAKALEQTKKLLY